MTVGSLTGGEGWLQANPEVFEQAARALVATAGAIQQVINRRDAAIQALTGDPSGWTGRASLQFTNAWARRREELLQQMTTQQDASIVYRRFAAALSDAQKAWQRLTEQAAQVGVVLTPEGRVSLAGLPPAIGSLTLTEEVWAVRTQADTIATQILDADRQAAAQLSELARRDPRPVVEDTTSIPVLLHAGMRGQLADTALPLGTDPNLVAAWFAALSPRVQQQLVRTAPNLMGNLNGLPPEVRDQANRLAITAALTTARAERQAASARVLQELEIIELDRRIETYEGLLVLGAGHTILAFSPEHNGRVAVAVGDITTARNIGVIVPGMDTTIDSVSNHLDSADLVRAEIRRRFGEGMAQDTAMVAWLDYDAPQGAEVANPFHPHANAGAPRLAAFTEGIVATHQGDPHLSILGHSYGSSTMSLAAADYGLPADKVVYFGSTGGLGAEHASQLNLADGAEVWAGRNLNDFVMGITDLHLGMDPVNEKFGANVFQANDETPIWDAHSNYLEPGPSLSNIARIVADRSEEVQLGVNRWGWFEQ